MLGRHSMGSRRRVGGNMSHVPQISPNPQMNFIECGQKIADRKRRERRSDRPTKMKFIQHNNELKYYM